MSAVPGSLLRRILFWAHLCSGIVAGVVILALSVTGVLLTYERQIVAAAAQGNRIASVPGMPALSADRLAQIARELSPATRRISLVFDADPAVPVAVTRGREAPLLLNPYTGEALPDAAAKARDFMRTIENWHRWLGGNGTSIRASIVDIANLLFLFMVLSGIYLWLPAVWRWRTVRGLVLFSTRYVNARVRDFNWHHVFSVWALLPLLLITLSGVVMSYGWANALVYAAYGEQPGQRRDGDGGGGSGGGDSSGGSTVNSGALASAGDSRASLDALLSAARAQVQDWQRLTLPVGGSRNVVAVPAELRSTQPRAPRRTVTLDARDASVVKISTPPDLSPGQRARSWFRLVHTGEEYGVIGQTVAGMASLSACFLVYTGLALACRRLLVPLLRRGATHS